jgi:hypothetical protein
MHRPHADFRFGHAKIRFLGIKVFNSAAENVAAWT